MKQQFKFTALVLALAAAGAAAPALAGEAIEFGDGYKFDWRLNTAYNVGMRLQDRDPKLSKHAGSNDGNNNFDKNALIANRVSALLDLKLSKGDSGLVFSGSSFYDDVYHSSNDNVFAVSKPGANNQFTADAKKYHGGYSRVLDAYGYTSFNLGEVRTTVRAGQFVVNWGEGLFFPGIGAAQGPLDGTKQGIPGTEAKDLFLPEQQIGFMFEVNPQWSLLAHYQFGFHELIAPAPGSFLNSSDGVGPGGVCLGDFMVIPQANFNDCSFGKRLGDNKPGSSGQWGVGTRYRVTEETELGLYYLNYKDRTPIPVIDAFAPGPFAALPVGHPLKSLGGGTYRVGFFDDIQLIGGTFSTRLGRVALAGEVSHKKGAPALVNTLVGGNPIPNPTRADITQLNLNAFANLGRVPGMDGLLVLAEIAGVTVRNVKKIRAPGAAEACVALAGPACPFVIDSLFSPLTNERTFGSGGLAIGGAVIPSYTNVFEGWDLDLPVNMSYQLRGRTLSGGAGGQGDLRVGAGAAMTYNRNLSLSVNYLTYLGSASTDQVNNRLLVDRDQVSFTAKYSF